MSVDKVKEYFKTLAKEYEVKEFNQSSATVELAAKALHTEPERIAKTLSFYDKEEDKCILIVVSGNSKIDNSKFKNQFKMKAKMLKREDVERLTGHPIGGVCPFANPTSSTIYLDCSLQKYPIVFPACGSPNSAIEISVADLSTLLKVEKFVDVCKEKEI